MNRWLKRAAIAVGAALVVTFSFFAYIALVVLDDPFDNRKFDRELWMAYQRSMDADNPRGEMYEDLTENLLRRGKTRDAVIALLGEPDMPRSDSCLSYNLGMWSGFRIDYDTLDICFDEEGNLRGTQRIQH